ncbi:RecBCD enzyme subunit RecD [Halomonadaceae bacterium LMG 33818]|uniref:exodeoxyribonuclease V subunit alpha n=1 Tax=Cernens ardua TaxID=3402176 RepID=UPI003EDC47EA
MSRSNSRNDIQPGLFDDLPVEDDQQAASDSINSATNAAQFTDESGPFSFNDWLKRWVALGWLRPLDYHFSSFIESDDEAVRLAAALTSHQLGRGHICLDIKRLLDEGAVVLSLPPQEGPQPEDTLNAQQLLASTGVVDADQWIERLAASPFVAVVDPTDEADTQSAPLVLDGTRLYLYRLWRAEGQVANILQRWIHTPLRHDAELAEQLRILFPEAPSMPPDWQKIACALAALQRLAIISGGPGTGKTTTVVKVLAALQHQALSRTGKPLTIRLAAPTGKAAARLAESISGAIDKAIPSAADRALITRESSTLHRLLGSRPNTRHFVHDEHNPLPLDVLVIDEASMIDLELMHATLSALPPSARLILLGDRDQLASVEAGAVLGELCSHSDGFTLPVEKALHVLTTESLPNEVPQSPLADNVVTLRHSYRFNSNSGIGALARAVNAGDAGALRACWTHGYKDIERLILRNEEDPAMIDAAVKGYQHYLTTLSQCSPQEALQRLGHFQLLCALRKGPWGVEGLNNAVQRALARKQLIDPTSEWYEGRPVMVNRNDHQLGLYNGDVGLTMKDPDDPTRLKVFFAQQSGVRGVSPGRLSAVETAFAMTVHKSQGSEFRQVLLVLPDAPGPILTRELLYTGITRAREACIVATASPGLLEYACQHRIWRDANLRERIQRPTAEVQSNTSF